ncbi:sensor histidine kinase [Roseomonas sp. NAR14]|uniref:histidine kinase n=1 Tax=Roseomonas acroporae TaxID=2937791 RepID=A0A9X2BYY6_9PROT|nr:sensor histidine kinase [Roseomonas acroporae]MCK8786495.1 sensor histidine kinase [Roseomonas acroporae]
MQRLLPASIRGRLLALLLLALLPVAVVVVANAIGAYQDALRDFEHRVELERDAAGARHAAVIEASRQLLGVLAITLPSDPAACSRLLGRLGPIESDRYQSVSVLDADGVVHCASRGDAIPDRLGDTPWFAELRSRREFTISGVTTMDHVAPTLLTAQPRVDGSGDFAGAVVAATPLQHFLGQPGNEGEDQPRLWLLGGDGTVRPLAPTTLNLALDDEQRDQVQAGHTIHLTSEAGSLLLAPARLGRDLILLVGQPATEALSNARLEGWKRIAELTALFSLCLAAVAIGARCTIMQPLQQLRAALIRWRESGGNLTEDDLAGLPVEVRDVADTFRRATESLATHEAELRHTLEQRDLLLAEIHHRVKNNLQVVSSLLNLQSQRIREPGARKEFEAARDRVRALATLHRHLYAHHDHETIDLRAFLEELTDQLFQAMGERPDERVSLRIAAPALRISSDQAVPLALVITEAVSNALKFAFPNGRRGTLSVTLTTADDKARLCIRDDGIGVPPAEMTQKRGLGGQLVRGLARQLGGTLSVESDAGTTVRLDFPLRAPVMRPATLKPSGIAAGTVPA